jgi:hypothetical protein
MSNDDTRSAPPPGVNLMGFQELKLLQAELLVHDSQLRNFTALRERLVAYGQDANARYRQIEARRDHVMAELKKLTPAPVRPAAGTASVRPLRPGGSLLSLPIAPVRFIPPIGPWFGYSGTVQMGFASEGATVVPQGKYRCTGSIYTDNLYDTGGIRFNGDLAVGPEGIIPGSDYDPSLQYVWLHNWYYLILFPAPVVTSTFTYDFKVEFLADIYRAGFGNVTLLSFISVGETANFVDQDVPVTTDVGWPMVADLTQSYSADDSQYNGIYGYLQGQSSGMRSFVVEGGQVPAVAVVLGVASAQSMMSEVRLNFPVQDEDGYIYPGSNGAGLVNFHYAPLPPEVES